MAAGGGDDGAGVQLCGAGRPGPCCFASRPADVERMLLEAQLDAEPLSPPPMMSPAGRDEAGAAALGQQPRPHRQRPSGRSRHRPPVQQEPPPREPLERRLPPTALPGCPRPRSLPGGADTRPFCPGLLLPLAPPLLLSHLLALRLGIYIGKRLAASSASPL